MKTRLSITLIALTILASFLMAACSTTEPTPSPAETTDSSGSSRTGNPEGMPAVYGLWMKEEETNQGTARELLTITEKSVYLVESTGGNGNGSLRETFFEITDVDWANEVITMSAKWVRINGNYGGFDYPLRYMKISIDGDNLYFSMGDEGQGIPAEAVNGPWLRR